MAILIQASLVRGLAVFGVLAKGRFATAIDTRLYLPKKWTDDQQRCNKAGIPENERVFKTKNQLALEIVEQARRNGVRFGWVGADAGYGSGPDLLWIMPATPSWSMFTRVSSSTNLIRSPQFQCFQVRGPKQGARLPERRV